MLPKIFAGTKIKIKDPCLIFNKASLENRSDLLDKTGVVVEDYQFELDDSAITSYSIKTKIGKEFLNIRRDSFEEV